MVEHSTADREVPGSNPGAPFHIFFSFSRRPNKQKISFFLLYPLGFFFFEHMRISLISAYLLLSADYFVVLFTTCDP